MIRLNRADLNLEAILRETGLNPSLSTRYAYHVYGLKGAAPAHPNPPVEVEIGGKGPVGVVQALKGLFAANQIQLVYGGAKPSYYGFTPHTVYVGLRRDLRSHTVFAACVLETIIAAIEGHLKVDRAFRFPGVPEEVRGLPKAEAYQVPTPVDANLFLFRGGGDEMDVIHLFDEPPADAPWRARVAEARDAARRGRAQIGRAVVDADLGHAHLI